MKAGDLVLVKPGTNVGPGTRYSSGIIIKVYNDPELTRWNGTPEIYMDIIWADGFQSKVDQRNITPYYEVIHNEAR